MTALRLLFPFLGAALWAVAGAAQDSRSALPLLPLFADDGKPAEAPGGDPLAASPVGSVAAEGEPETAESTRSAEGPGPAEAQPAGSRFAREFSAKAAAERAEPPPRVLPDVVAVPGLGGAFGECPRELLRVLLGAAAERADALSAVALETELLVLCRERQTLVNQVLKLELEIGELIAPAAAEPAAAETPEEERPVVVIADLQAGAAEAGLKIVAEKEAKPPPEPEPTAASYVWFSIIGMPGRLTAGVSDGEGVWFVREGDALPGDVEVGTIFSRPPGVQVFGEEEDAMLPYGPRPPGAVSRPAAER